MARMSRDEWHAFLQAGTRTGKLATVRADGRPHVAPIWFVVDGDDLVFNTAAESVKGRNLRRDPRVSIVVDDQEPPYSYVMVEGTAALSEDLAEMLTWSTVIGGRYMGAGNAEAFGRRNAVPGEYLVRVRVTKVVAEKGVAS